MKKIKSIILGIYFLLMIFSFTIIVKKYISVSNTYKIQEIIKSEMNIPDNSELEEDLDKKNIINFYANNNKLIKEIDWIPKVDITEGIRRCILNKS